MFGLKNLFARQRPTSQYWKKPPITASQRPCPDERYVLRAAGLHRMAYGAEQNPEMDVDRIADYLDHPGRQPAAFTCAGIITAM
jgi:hypothetical protein